MTKANRKEQLKPSINAMLLNMITIGGSIGTGIFMASGHALYLAGPSGTIASYLLVGIITWFLMSILAEMSAKSPMTGGFYCYVSQFVSPALGYALGWTYWYSWAVTIASEISVSGIIMHNFNPDVPVIIWNTLFMAGMLVFNIISVKSFAIAESFFSFIKLSVITIFIFTGILILTGYSPNHQYVGFKLWNDAGAAFHPGITGILGALLIAGFSFQGTELIGITAGECNNPSRDIPKVVRHVFWRILIVFILTIFVICSLIPHTISELSSGDSLISPLTLVFQHYNMKGIAWIVNCVILSAILSAGNCGLYVSSRVLLSMAQHHHAPKFLDSVNQRGVPIKALSYTIVTVVFIFLTSLSNTGSLYLLLINAAGTLGFLTWACIALSHYNFRKHHIKNKTITSLPYLSKFFPLPSIFVFCFSLVAIFILDIEWFMKPKSSWTEFIINQIGILLFIFLWGFKTIRPKESKHFAFE
jgi:lysine-specific permease